MARPTKLTKEVLRRVADGVRVTMSLEAAAARAGVDRRTVYNWRERGRREQKGIYYDFYLAIEAAMADAEFDILIELRRAGKSKPWILIWILERRVPERWGKQTRDANQPEKPSAQEIALAMHDLVLRMKATVPTVPPTGGAEGMGPSPPQPPNPPPKAAA